MATESLDKYNCCIVSGLLLLFTWCRVKQVMKVLGCCRRRTECWPLTQLLQRPVSPRRCRGRMQLSRSFHPPRPRPRPRPGAAHALITMAQCPHISWPRAPHADILIPGHGLTTALLHPSLTAFHSRRRGISSSTYPHKVIFSH